MPSPPLCGKLSWNAPWISRQHTTAPTATPSTALRAPKMVRLQDLGDCSQSSQIGPHLLQPLSTGPMATMLKINARLNFVDHSPFPSCSLKSGIFKPRNSPVPFRRMPFRMRENTRSRVERGTAVSCNMNHKPRILISRKPGAFLATCSPRGCRISVYRSAISNAPRRPPRIPADDDGRSDHAFHARRRVLGRTGRCAGGAPRAHHELWPRHPVERHRQQAGGDGLKRLCDAVSRNQYPPRRPTMPPPRSPPPPPIRPNPIPIPIPIEGTGGGGERR